MVLVTVNRVYKAMEENLMPYWILKEGKYEIDRCQEAGISIEVSKQKLQETLNEIVGANVDILLSNTPHSEKAAGGRGYRNLEYKVKISSAVSVSAAGPDSTTITLLKQIAELNNKIIEITYQQKFDKLQEQFEAFKNKKEDQPFYAASLKTLTEYVTSNPAVLNGIFGGAFPSAPALAGTPEVDELAEPVTAETKIKLREALVRLSRVDNNLPETLSMLADFAEKNPEKYHSFIPMLKS